jgi:hypothetical protein
VAAAPLTDDTVLAPQCANVDDALAPHGPTLHDLHLLHRTLLI